MSLKIGPFKTAVEARISGAYPNLPVFISEIPEDGVVSMTDSTFTPYVVLFYGGPIRTAGGHSLVSSRQDATIVFVTLEAHAPQASVAGLIKDNLVDLLAGFYPPDCGEMILEGGFAYSRAYGTVRPTKYIETAAFTARSNLTTV